MLNPDNYIQNPQSTQSYNRYSYVLNNPLKYTDPDGEWVHILAGALIGGFINGLMHANQGVDGFLKGFAIGAVAGAVTAATGGMAAGYFATGTMVGISAGAAYTIGVTGGAIAGASGAVLGAPILAAGNYVAFGENYSWKRYAIDIVGGGIIGGVAGGISAAIKGYNIWSGAPKGTGTTAFTNPKYNLEQLKQAGYTRLKNGKWIRMPGLGFTESGGLQRVVDPEYVSELLTNYDIVSGQKYISANNVEKYYLQMLDGTFDPSKYAVGGYLKDGTTFVVTEGNHRVVAAAIYGMKTGNFNVLNTLINSGRFVEYTSNYAIFKFPTIWH